MKTKLQEKLLTSVLILFIATSLICCSDEAGTLLSIQLTPEAAAIRAGTVITIEVKGTYSASGGGTETDREVEDVSWSSSNEAVCQMKDSMSGEPQVYGVADGTAVITVSKGDISSTVDITVGLPIISTFSILPEGIPLKINIEDNQQFSATGGGGEYDRPGDFTGYDITAFVTWSSDTPAVLSIDSAGLGTTGNEIGTAIISAVLDEEIQGDPLPSDTASLNIEVIRTASAALSATGVPEGTGLLRPLLHAAGGINPGRAVGACPAGASFSGGNLNTDFYETNAGYYTPQVFNTLSSIQTGDYSFHVIADNDGSGTITAPDTGAVISVTAAAGLNAEAAGAVTFQTLVEEVIEVTDTGSGIPNSAILYGCWLAEGSTSIDDSIATALIADANLTEPYPDGLRAYNFAGTAFSGGTAATDNNDLMPPGTYDLCVFIDNENDGTINTAGNDYLFYIPGLIVDGGTATNIDTELSAVISPP